MADKVIFIYRDELYNPTPQNKGLAELMLSKQRNGPTANCGVMYIAENTNFCDMGRSSE